MLISLTALHHTDASSSGGTGCLQSSLPGIAHSPCRQGFCFLEVCIAKSHRQTNARASFFHKTPFPVTLGSALFLDDPFPIQTRLGLGTKTGRGNGTGLYLFIYLFGSRVSLSLKFSVFFPFLIPNFYNMCALASPTSSAGTAVKTLLDPRLLRLYDSH